MKVLQGPLLERGAGAGCELISKFRKRGRAQDGPKLGPRFMPGQKKNRNSNRKMKVSGGSALPDRAGGLVFLELPVGGRMQKSKKIVQEALTNIKSTHSRWEMASVFSSQLDHRMRRNKKGIFLLMLEVGQVGGILRGTLCFFSAFPSGPGQSSGKCWFGEGRGPVSAKGAFHRLSILLFFFDLYLENGLVFWKLWSRFLAGVVSFLWGFGLD